MLYKIKTAQIVIEELMEFDVGLSKVGSMLRIILILSVRIIYGCNS